MNGIKKCAAFCFASLAITANAGGSFVSVSVREFVRISDTKFRMVVAPVREDPKARSDPYMRQCINLTVIGQFRKLDGFPGWINRETHIAAITRLENAYKAKQTTNFGWMGQGLFVVEKSKPCMVRSRALDIYNTRDGVFAVMSYYAAV